MVSVKIPSVFAAAQAARPYMVAVVAGRAIVEVVLYTKAHLWASLPLDQLEFPTLPSQEPEP